MVKKTVLFDSDGLVYAAAFAAQASVGKDATPSDGLAIKCLENYITSHLSKLKQHFYTAAQIRAGVDLEVRHYLTSNDRSNFRFLVDPEYKSSRKATQKPASYPILRDYLISQDAEVVSGAEAEDMVAIVAGELPIDHTVICSMDKDMLQVPGWHFVIGKVGEYQRRPFFVTKKGTMCLERTGGGAINLFATGDYMLAFQLLHGDSTDDIPPLEKGWGPKKCFDLLHTLDCPFDAVYIEYRKVYKNGWKKEVVKKLALVKMLRTRYSYEHRHNIFGGDDEPDC